VSIQEEAKADRVFNRSMMFKLVVVAVAMFGFGFALVPMYRAICSIKGINNLVQRDVGEREAKNTQVGRAVRFQSNSMRTRVARCTSGRSRTVSTFIRAKS
jgi:cytochrome c oxidase assembly protein Cox11